MIYPLACRQCCGLKLAMGGSVAAQCPTRGPLEEHGLALKDLKCLFQACDLGLTPCLARLVCLRLGDALLLELLQVLQDRIKLGLEYLEKLKEQCDSYVSAL